MLRAWLLTKEDLAPAQSSVSFTPANLNELFLHLCHFQHFFKNTQSSSSKQNSGGMPSLLSATLNNVLYNSQILFLIFAFYKFSSALSLRKINLNPKKKKTLRMLYRATFLFMQVKCRYGKLNSFILILIICVILFIYSVISDTRITPQKNTSLVHQILVLLGSRLS